MRSFLKVLTFFILLIPAVPTQAAGANEYVSGTSSATTGDSVSASIIVNTSGQSANSFEATISWPSFLTPTKGTRGGVCSFYIDEPSSPSGGSGTVSCGKSNGFVGTGTLYTISFQASSAGSGSFGLSGCTVLANDGNGTNITGGCSGQSISVANAPQAAAPSSNSAPPPATITKTATPKPVAKPSSSQTPTPAENAQTPAPTQQPTAPPVQALPVSTTLPTSSAAASSTGSSTAPQVQQKRSIGKALSDLIGSLKQITLLPKDGTGAAALLLTLIPVLALALAIVFFLYRLYVLESKRRRSLNRLFELELSELSALEGKMDLLVEKGNKGRQQYVEEFEKTKQHILQQLRPDYGKPVEPTVVP